MGKALSLSDRMKEYENVTNASLTKRTPVIIRLDGVAFHTFTKRFIKPYDEFISRMMMYVSVKLKERLNNIMLIYSQSDEISILMYDGYDVNVDCWYGNRIQKLCSVSAAYATMRANEFILNEIGKITDAERLSLLANKVGKVMFDSRVFNIPINDVANYFVWRQQDAIRNSKQDLGQAYFSQRQLHKKNTDEVISMVKEECGIDWNELDTIQKWGFCVIKNSMVDNNGQTLASYELDEPPLFTENRNYIEKYL